MYACGLTGYCYTSARRTVLVASFPGPTQLSVDFFVRAQGEPGNEATVLVGFDAQRYLRRGITITVQPQLIHTVVVHAVVPYVPAAS